MEFKRKIEVLVLSDIHLGTFGCHADELLKYLKSIDPETIILNGDIIDIWNFKKKYWPKSHMLVLKKFLSMVAKGKQVIYITGNHDETIRKFAGFEVPGFKVVNKYSLRLNGSETLFFHGDIFDVVMEQAKWLAKLGAVGYDLIIWLNHIVNNWLRFLGKQPISMSKKIKNSVKSAVKFINDFEKVCGDLASQNGYDTVVCGHIHQPAIKKVKTDKGTINYLNSGDWIENLSALEYSKGEWTLYHYNDDTIAPAIPIDADINSALNNKELFSILQQQFYNHAS
ncbi:UDP-2,3-diacylglucosamine diphosphatase [Marinigracilibium pacificum]|uniref:UDP-2,3-diacylglucosamine diphosphatase n=1 Tax=Marinigracilibium pacificum TaxID=2729599 RepID=A0A848ISS9_9BACT|nr:UDP-2,3-diacylglucosamine diphosphatase [Marinigracilibium pacificum]NMM46836.1 UDP-2,3-diacylglucosamine diphosphatase [Marinigracilibium pacificum]